MAEKTVSILPPINQSPDNAQTTTIQIEVPSQGNNQLNLGPTSKEIMIGSGVMLVLAIIFFVLRMAFVNYLIGPSMKRSPNNAGFAGWGLFGGLFFGSAIGCTALVSKLYMTLPIIIPLACLSLICFVIALVVASKK